MRRGGDTKGGKDKKTNATITCAESKMAEVTMESERQPWVGKTATQTVREAETGRDGENY